jgi:hypothetical protein
MSAARTRPAWSLPATELGGGQRMTGPIIRDAVD